MTQRGVPGWARVPVAGMGAMISSPWVLTLTGAAEGERDVVVRALGWMGMGRREAGA